MKELKVRITFTEEILGTSPGDADIYRTYIGSKSPDATTLEDEVSAIGADAVAEKGMTFFPKTDDGNPFLWDYQIKGYFKDTCKGLKKVLGTKSNGIKAYKQEIDKLIFVKERRIPIHIPAGSSTGECSRPLRAQTPQGERVSLANSETCPAGSEIEFTILMYLDTHEQAVREWLDYGKLSGIGQWRNSGKGRFIWEEVTA